MSQLLKLVLSTSLIFLIFTHLIFVVYWVTPANSLETHLYSPSKNSTALTDSERAAVKKELGLSDNWREGLSVFYRQLKDGTWGFSLSQGLPVRSLVFSRAQTSLDYILPSLFFLLLFSGCFVLSQLSVWKGTSHFLSFSNSLLLCIPLFVFAVFWYSFLDGLPPGVSLLALSVLTALPTLNHIAFKRLKQELALPYIQAVRAKGLSSRTLLIRHLFKPYLWVFISLLPWWWSVSLGCAIIAEPLFRVSGLGLLAFDSFRQQDLPVLLGISLFWGFCRIAIGGIRELLFTFLVPFSSEESSP